MCRRSPGPWRSVDAPQAALYRDGAARYAARIEETDAWIAAVLGSIPAEQRRIITTHDAFGYYGARYAIEFLSAEGISTEFEPSAKAITALVRQIEREKVRAVFIENMTRPKNGEDAGSGDRRGAGGNGVFGRVVASGRAGSYIFRDDAAQHDAVRGGHAAGRLDRRATTSKTKDHAATGTAACSIAAAVACHPNAALMKP